MIRCKACLNKVDDSTIQNGVCPECSEKEKQMTYRSPLTAVLMSILPGAAHKFYLGQDKKGSAILLIFLISFLFFPILPLSWLYAAGDAFLEARRINND